MGGGDGGGDGAGKAGGDGGVTNIGVDEEELEVRNDGTGSVASRKIHTNTVGKLEKNRIAMSPLLGLDGRSDLNSSPIAIDFRRGTFAVLLPAALRRPFTILLPVCVPAQEEIMILA